MALEVTLLSLSIHESVKPIRQRFTTLLSGAVEVRERIRPLSAFVVPTGRWRP
jgi:hypothetical protein